MDFVSILAKEFSLRPEHVQAVIEMLDAGNTLKIQLAKAQTLAELEDLYRPFRPKRRTRATIAKERGLEPLALWLLLQLPKGDVQAEAAKYVNEEKEVPDAEAALAGARDILAEQVSDDAAVRKELRETLLREGVIETKAAKEEDSVYSMYYDWKRTACIPCTTTTRNPCPKWRPTASWPSTGASGKNS